MMEVFGNVILVEAPILEKTTKSGLHLISNDAMAQSSPVKCVVKAVPHETKKVKPGDTVMVDSMAVMNMRMCFDEEDRLFFVKHEQVYSKLTKQEIKDYDSKK